MPTTENGYNGSHTGEQIDAAVSAVRQKEGTWDRKQNAMVYVPITLRSSSWSSEKTQTVLVSGVLADETKQLIQPVPSSASQSAYYDAGVICTGQSADSLTFACQTTPTEDLMVYIVIQEVSVLL